MSTLGANDRAVLLDAADFCDHWAAICRNSGTIPGTERFTDPESEAEYNEYVRTAKKLRKIAAAARRNDATRTKTRSPSLAAGSGAGRRKRRGFSGKG